MKSVFYLIVSGLLILLVCSVNTTMANAGTHETSGKATMTYTKKEVAPLSDTEGHILMLGVSSGPNSNIGNWDFMDGAIATASSTADLTKGNGPQAGYFTLSKDGNKTIAKYNGTIKTVLSPDGKPMTSFSGKWQYIKCAGIYEGCTGEGTYQGHFIAENDYIVEFKGTLVQ